MLTRPCHRIGFCTLLSQCWPIPDYARTNPTELPLYPAGLQRELRPQAHRCCGHLANAVPLRAVRPQPDVRHALRLSTSGPRHRCGHVSLTYTLILNLFSVPKGRRSNCVSFNSREYDMDGLILRSMIPAGGYVWVSKEVSAGLYPVHMKQFLSGRSHGRWDESSLQHASSKGYHIVGRTFYAHPFPVGSSFRRYIMNCCTNRDLSPQKF